MRTPHLLAFCFFSAAACQGADFWSPINQDELNLKTAKVQPDASAEVLFWETRLENGFGSGYGETTLSHYLRIKIFTEKGREAASVEVPYFRGKTVSNVAGRTIKPDGTVKELKGDAIFDKEVVRVSGLKVRARTFVLPDVAPGDVIEYRYRENWEGIINHIRMPMQRTIPVQKATFKVKPLSSEYTSFGMRVQVFHAANKPFTPDKDHFYASSFENMPAYREEPYMPPEDEIRAWMLVYYSEKSNLVPDKFWLDYGRKSYASTKPLMKASDDVKRLSEELVTGATTPLQKLTKLYTYCQTKIKNSNTIEVSADTKKDMKVNKTPSDTLRQGMGTGTDIDNLFAALATAAGFDARSAWTSDRSDTFLDPNFPDPYFLDSRNIAIRLDDKWIFCDPANRFLPFGMLRWQEEGTNALVTDPKDPTWAQTPLTSGDSSKTVRTGSFKLAEDGTLEGDIRIAYTGHEMVARKSIHQKDSPDKWRKDVEEGFLHRLPGSEITAVKIDNSDGVLPLVYTYHVKVPGYAQRTGKRLFVQPAFFQRNTQPKFPNSERKYAIYFEHPWSEQDNIEIDLPDGYELDHADAPAGFKSGEVFSYSVKMSLRNKKTLVYQRELLQAGFIFQPKAYTPLKALFDGQFKSDEHLITLKSGMTTGGLQP